MISNPVESALTLLPGAFLRLVFFGYARGVSCLFNVPSTCLCAHLCGHQRASAHTCASVYTIVPNCNFSEFVTDEWSFMRISSLLLFRSTDVRHFFFVSAFLRRAGCILYAFGAWFAGVYVFPGRHAQSSFFFPWWIPCPRGCLVSIPGGHQAPAVFMRILRRSTVFILLVFEIMFILSCTDFLPGIFEWYSRVVVFSEHVAASCCAARTPFTVFFFFVCVWVFGWTVAVTNPAARACGHARSCSRVC